MDFIAAHKRRAPIYMAFDCLYVDGRDLRPQGLRKRRQALEQVIAARRLAPQGLTARQEVREHGYEGWWEGRRRSVPRLLILQV